MLNKIIEFSVRNKLIIGLFTAALALFGIYETTKLPIDAVPMQNATIVQNGAYTLLMTLKNKAEE
ncbi:MAG TPA: hypothetical protein PK872_06195 [Ferruginibacter sp.]|nr:hypothetical protein [Ferruginibacter sp.]